LIHYLDVLGIHFIQIIFIYFKIIGRPIHESNGTLSLVRHHHRLKSSNAGIHSFVLQL